MLDSQVSRVSQLTERTNQFNCTAIRRREAEIQNLSQLNELEFFVVEVSDRFGNYGLVGTIMFRTNAKALEVDTFLLSCRVLGRGVEHQMLAKIGEIAKERSLNYINIPYIPTNKNQPALDFLQEIATQFKEPSNNHLIFNLPTEHAVSITHNPAILRDHTPKTKKTGKDRTFIDKTFQSRSLFLERITTELFNVEHIIKDIKLKKKYELCSHSENNYIAPRNPIEEIIAEIWSRILGLKKVSMYDNFFELGGHSLSATQMMSRIYEIFNVELSLQVFFDMPTVADTACAVEKRTIEQTESQDVLEILKEIDNLSENEIKTFLNPKGGEL